MDIQQQQKKSCNLPSQQILLSLILKWKLLVAMLFVVLVNVYNNNFHCLQCYLFLSNFLDTDSLWLQWICLGWPFFRKTHKPIWLWLANYSVNGIGVFSYLYRKDPVTLFVDTFLPLSAYLSRTNILFECSPLHDTFKLVFVSSGKVFNPCGSKKLSLKLSFRSRF